MHDDHSDTPAGRPAPEAERQAAGERAAADAGAPPGDERPARARHPDPTRYGDWEKGGRCIDF